MANIDEQAVGRLTIEVGDVVKIHNWFGVVLETHRDEDGALSIIRVQTTRNLFRGHGPEYVDVRMQPEAIEQAALTDLEQEIATHQRLLDGAVGRLRAAAQTDREILVAAD